MKSVQNATMAENVFVHDIQGVKALKKSPILRPNYIIMMQLWSVLFMQH